MFEVGYVFSLLFCRMLLVVCRCNLDLFGWVLFVVDWIFAGFV